MASRRGRPIRGTRQQAARALVQPVVVALRAVVRRRHRDAAQHLNRRGAETCALVAVAAACLALYDMAKAVDRGIVVEQSVLLEKSGGRSGSWRRPNTLK